MLSLGLLRWLKVTQGNTLHDCEGSASPAFLAWTPLAQNLVFILYIAEPNLLIFWWGSWCLCSWGILVSYLIFLFYLWYLNHVSLIQWVRQCFSSIFSRHLYRIGGYSAFCIEWTPPRKPHGPKIFFVWRFLTIDLTSLTDIGLLKWSISSSVSFANSCLSRN